MEPPASTFLNDTWSLYFHDPEDEDWSEKSYKHVATMSSVEDFIGVQKNFEDAWSKGMFFVMREHIKPLWEDEHNCNGGCISFKIMKNEVSKFWFLFSGMVVGENIMHGEHKHKLWDKVCGVSISPKRSFCILRVWISDKDYGGVQYYNIEPPSYTKIMFKSYCENKDFQT
jgi:translation initiation factor 4E